MKRPLARPSAFAKAAADKSATLSPPCGERAGRGVPIWFRARMRVQNWRSGLPMNLPPHPFPTPSLSPNGGEGAQRAGEGRLRRPKCASKTWRSKLSMSGDWPTLLAVAESEVQHILRALPRKLQAEARRLPVAFERRPGKELQEDAIEPDTLGLFVGEAYPDGEGGGVALPPQIVLFLTNIWEAAEEDEAVYREEIRTTFLHELGHYFGFDETDLEERGLE